MSNKSKEIPEENFLDPRAIKEQYLVDYLTEEFTEKFNGEFKNNSDLLVRVHTEDNERGVLVRSPSREYFFPFEWMMTSQGFKRVQALVQQIRALYS